MHIFKSLVFSKCAQLPLFSWVIKGGVFVHFSSSGEDLGKTIADIRWRVRCIVPLEAGEKHGLWIQRFALWGFWVWNTEKQGLRAAELRSIYHEPDSLLSGPRKEKETVLIRDWPWLVENRLWNYPSWDNKKNTLRGEVWSLEQDCWDLVIQMTLSKFFRLSEPQFPHLWIGNSIS